MSTDSGSAAIALRYDSDDGVPKVVATGEGITAKTILALAQEHGIPVLEDDPLINALRDLDVGDYIHPALYVAVAEALVWAWNVELPDTN